jgi:integrase/recombinase XerD
LTTARYTQLTDGTQQNAGQLINALMNGFAMDWGKVK